MNSINWGIIGLGKMARIFAEDLVRVNECRLYAVASRSKEKARNFGKQFPAEKYYSNHLEIIDDTAVDVIYIATPHSAHFELAKQSLLAKKHVLCEKPLCLNLRETQELIELARVQECFLMEAIWTRFMPSTKKLIQLLNEQQIGSLICVEADFGFQAQFDKNSRLFNKSLGGGSLMDIGIYPLFLSQLCLGTPKTIQALARKAPTGVDSSCYMQLDYSNGQKALLKSTFEVNTPCEAMIYGTNGSIKIHNRFHQSEKIEIFDSQQNSLQVFELPYSGNGYIHEIEEVNQCIMQSKIESDLLPLDFSLQLAKTMEEVKRRIEVT